MIVGLSRFRAVRHALTRHALLLSCLPFASVAAQQLTTDTRDPNQKQDTTFAKSYQEWLANPKHGSPLVDHLPVVAGIPTPRDVLGYHIGAPRKLTYYADQLKYYRALAAASPRVNIETIGRSDEGRELVVVWITSEANMQRLDHNRKNLARIADPRGFTEAQVKALLADTKPHYHLMGGLHSGETGPSEMLMELAYRLVTETSPLINQIREQLYVSFTPAADADGRDRNVDWFFRGLDMAAAIPAPPSFVALPPSPTSSRVAPDTSTACRINSPVPKVLARRGFRSAAAIRPIPLAAAISITATVSPLLR